ncbi:MAG: RidA family protein [Gammaproteobacteria bacterium]|nr:RidA family protein [Gammaproteobacteria bacterium]
MSREIISTEAAPAAIGAYSQAVKVGRSESTVYISGQIPLDPVTMQVVSDNFADQAEQVFVNLAAVASAAGGALSDSVKLTVYLTDLGNFALLNEMMSKYFTEPYPARAAVQVSALPKQVQIEIDAVLCLD